MKKRLCFFVLVLTAISVFSGYRTGETPRENLETQDLIKQSSLNDSMNAEESGVDIVTNVAQMEGSSTRKAGEKQRSRKTKDQYGGLRIAQFETTGFFRLENLGDRWFLVTPEGHPFYLLALNGVTPWYGDYKKNSYETKYKKRFRIWANVAIDRVNWLGFNAVAHKTTEDCIRQMMQGNVWKMPFTVLVPFIGEEAMEGGEYPYPDVFAEGFVEFADSLAKQYCNHLKDEPYLVGYFLGNELDFQLYWKGEISWRSRWLKKLLKQQAGSPARKQLAALFVKMFGTVDKFNKEFEGTGVRFTSFDEIGFKQIWPAFKKGSPQAVKIMKMYNALIAKRFYKLTSEAIRKYDKNHLILGTRFANDAEVQVLKATRDFTDVVSFNRYEKEVPTALYEKMSQNTGRPLFHTEFSFLEQGRNGAYPGVPDQETRGRYYADFLSKIVEDGRVIGFGWHQMIEPKEDRNFGLFDIHDEPYYNAIKHVMEANRMIEERFAEVIAEKISK